MMLHVAAPSLRCGAATQGHELPHFHVTTTGTRTYIRLRLQNWLTRKAKVLWEQEARAAPPLFVQDTRIF